MNTGMLGLDRVHDEDGTTYANGERVLLQASEVAIRELPADPVRSPLLRKRQ